MKAVSFKTFRFVLLAMMLVMSSAFAQSASKAELLDRYYAKVVRPFLEGALTAGLTEGAQNGAPDFSSCPAGEVIYTDMMKTRMPAFFRSKIDGDFKHKILSGFERSLTEADLQAMLRFIDTDEGKVYQQRLLASQGKEADALKETQAYRNDPALRSYQAHVEAVAIADVNPLADMDLEKDAEWQAMMSRFQTELMGVMMGCASEPAPAKGKPKGG